MVFRRIDNGECIVGHEAIVLFFIRLHPGGAIRVVGMKGLGKGARARAKEITCRYMGGRTSDDAWCLGPARKKGIRVNVVLVVMGQVGERKGMLDLAIAGTNLEVPGIVVGMVKIAAVIMAIV
jgi:hypothetical protein